MVSAGPLPNQGATNNYLPNGLNRYDDGNGKLTGDRVNSCVYDVESLRLRYPGAAEIIGTWWANAHGRRSKVDVLGTASRGVASGVIRIAIDSYQSKKR